MPARKNPVPVVDEHNDAQLAAAGVTLAPPAPERPDITPAQVVAGVSALIGQAVAYGILDPGVAQNAIHQVTFDLPLVWIAADALIRVARNFAHAYLHRAS
jgi:hypothetical protein